MTSVDVLSKASSLCGTINQFNLLNLSTFQHHLSTTQLKLYELKIPYIPALDILHLNKLQIIFTYIDFALQWGIIIRLSILAKGHIGLLAYNQGGLSDPLFDEKCIVEKDYSPCLCYSVVAQIGIICVDVNLRDVSVAFKNYDEFDVQIFLLHFPRTTVILSDLIGVDHRITEEIHFKKCSKTGYVSQGQLIIHPDAFRSSRNYTRVEKITFCDLSKLDFSFLNNFRQLNVLYIASSVKVHQADWGSLVSLPTLSSMQIDRCGINGWKEFPRLVTGLSKVALNWDDIEDATMGRILHWLLTTSSETLQDLQITFNALTHFPAKMSSFKNLQEAFFTRQTDYISGIKILGTGSYINNERIRNLELGYCGIQYIEPGAFLGDFSQAVLTLSHNLLTRFEKYTFLGMLLQMANSIRHQYRKKETM